MAVTVRAGQMPTDVDVNASGGGVGEDGRADVDEANGVDGLAAGELHGAEVDREDLAVAVVVVVAHESVGVVFLPFQAVAEDH